MAFEHAEPVAWIAFASDGSESSAVYTTEEAARAAADEYNWCISPLYSAPTLTDAERDAVKYFAEFQWTMLKPHAATLRGLLERTK